MEGVGLCCICMALMFKVMGDTDPASHDHNLCTYLVGSVEPVLPSGVLARIGRFPLTINAFLLQNYFMLPLFPFSTTALLLDPN